MKLSEIMTEQSQSEYARRLTRHERPPLDDMFYGRVGIVKSWNWDNLYYASEVYFNGKTYTEDHTKTEWEGVDILDFIKRKNVDLNKVVFAYDKDGWRGPGCYVGFYEDENGDVFLLNIVDDGHTVIPLKEVDY